MGFPSKPKGDLIWLIGPAAIFGGLGGEINAWFCYAEIFGTVRGVGHFQWPILLAGVWHGAWLAAVPLFFSFLLWKRPAAVRWLVLPLVGWIAAWISFMSIHFYYVKDPLAAAIWSVQPTVEAMWVPFCYFGLVGSLYYFLLSICRILSSGDLRKQLAAGVFSGFLGSLWWWSGWKLWYLSLLHGMVWGVLVGISVWRFAKTRGGRL